MQGHKIPENELHAASTLCSPRPGAHGQPLQKFSILLLYAPCWIHGWIMPGASEWRIGQISGPKSVNGLAIQMSLSVILQRKCKKSLIVKYLKDQISIPLRHFHQLIEKYQMCALISLLILPSLSNSKWHGNLAVNQLTWLKQTVKWHN